MSATRRPGEGRRRPRDIEKGYHVIFFFNAGVPENVVADIVGHEKTTMTYGLYSGGLSLVVKHEALNKLAY